MLKNTDLQNFFFKKENAIYQHILFWVLVVLVFVIFKEYPAYLKNYEIACFIIQFLGLMAIPGYVHNIFILPLFKKKKFGLGLILFVTEVLVLTLILPYIFNGVAQLFVALFNIKQWVRWENENISFNIIGFIVMASVINIARERILLQKEQKEAELKQLKEQLNPHFLFNTLNNLYGLSVVKSEKLPALMLKLSDLLRYSLYETNHTMVSLEKELAYINNYIELEKIRLEERTTITLDISGDFNDHSLAPLLLIVFIENSFKHHSSKRNEKGFIKISFHANEEVFEMSLINSLDPSVIPVPTEKKAGGIGLSNAKKRLDLIYGEKYTLTFERKPEFYKVDLKILF